MIVLNILTKIVGKLLIMLVAGLKKARYLPQEIIYLNLFEHELPRQYNSQKRIFV